MDQPRTEMHEAERDDAIPDALTSTSPGGAGQVEQEPARGRRMGRDPSARADADIRAEIDALLATSDDFDPNRLDVLVSEGVVVMLGRVPDYEAKRRLEELCAGVRGVRELHDQLQLEDDAISTSSDGLRTEAPRAGFRGPNS